MRYTYVYLLTDVREEFFYIGKSDNPEKRFGEHLGEARRYDGSYYSPKCEWMQDLFEMGELPYIQKTSKIPHDEWEETERMLIAKFRDRYGRDRVTNATDGGDAPPGTAILTWDDIDQIRQSNRPPKELSNLYKVSTQHIRCILRNERWVDENFPTHINKVEKLDWDDVNKIRYELSDYLNNVHIATIYKVSPMTISRIIRNISRYDPNYEPPPPIFDELNWEMINHIRKYCQNKTASEISNIYNISRTQAYRIIKNKLKSWYDQEYQDWLDENA